MNSIFAYQSNIVPLTPVSFLKFAERTYPNQTAWIYEGRRATYAEFGQRCRKLATLLKSMGVGVQDVVTVIAPNIPAMLELHYAVPMIGAVLNTLNIRQDDAHYEWVMGQAKPAVVFADIEYLARIKTVLSRCNQKPPIIAINDPDTNFASYDGPQEFEKLLADTRAENIVDIIASELAPIVLNYTSGTSGKPKGVVHSHRAAYLNAVGISMLWNLPILPTYLWVVPLFHSNGWSLSWAITARAGTHILQRKVIPAKIFAALEQHNVTHFCCAPTVLDMLLGEAETHGRQNGMMVEIGTGGSSPNAARIKKLREINFNITHLYGMTETLSNSVYCAPQPDWDGLGPAAYSDEIRRQGVAQPMVEEVDVFDVNTNHPLAHDGESVGEVRIRSNTVMSHYFKAPEETANTMQDGWLKTGDLGVIHGDGYLELVDRLKDIIISGGENISSMEIEDALSAHDSVEGAAVVAMADDKWGEVPCAFVKLAPSTRMISEEKLLQWCLSRLSRFKRPKRIIFVDQFILTATGKIQKNHLRTQLTELLTQEEREK